MPAVLPVTEMQRNGSALVEQAIATKEPIYLTRHGRSAVVLMDADEFDKRMRLQKDIFDHEMRVQEGIATGHMQIAQGSYKTLDDTRAFIDEKIALCLKK